MHEVPGITAEVARFARHVSRAGMTVFMPRLFGKVCRPARFATLRRSLGEGFEGIELPGSSANPAPEPPHSVLTIGLIDREGEPTRAAVDRVVDFLRERLLVVASENDRVPGVGPRAG